MRLRAPLITAAAQPTPARTVIAPTDLAPLARSLASRLDGGEPEPFAGAVRRMPELLPEAPARRPAEPAIATP